MLLPPLPQFIQNILPRQHGTPAWYFWVQHTACNYHLSLFITLASEPLITVWREDLVSLGCAFNPVTQEPCWAHLSILNWAPRSAGMQQGERGEALSPWEAPGVENSKAGTVRFIPG